MAVQRKKKMQKTFYYLTDTARQQRARLRQTQTNRQIIRRGRG